MSDEDIRIHTRVNGSEKERYLSTCWKNLTAGTIVYESEPMQKHALLTDYVNVVHR